jgi:hypothetical protein
VPSKSGSQRRRASRAPYFRKRRAFIAGEHEPARHRRQERAREAGAETPGDDEAPAGEALPRPRRRPPPDPRKIAEARRLNGLG